MNVGRGFFRAWILLSVLWAAVIGIIAYTEIPRQISSPMWAYVHLVRNEIDMKNINWSRPYYENMHSPSAEKLEPEFSELEFQYRADWRKLVNEGKIISVTVPDGSNLYLPIELNDQDREYVTAKFWGHRWKRWFDASRWWAVGIFGPTIVLFVLGWALLWVGRGFKTIQVRD
jgi:hypothetical protein